MPFSVSRKRQRTKSNRRSNEKESPKTVKKRKVENPTLFDAADAITKPEVSRAANDELLRELEESEDSLSSNASDEDEFEDALHDDHIRSDRSLPNRSATHGHENHEDDDVEFEDAMKVEPANDTGVNSPSSNNLEMAAPSGFELTLDKPPTEAFSTWKNSRSAKKGPSKTDRQIRVGTHCLHVQFLLFHNVFRNAWACDKELQGTLRNHLTPGVKEEIERWRSYCGDALQISNTDEKSPKKRSRGKSTMKSFQNTSPKLQRDWGEAAELLDESSVNLIRGDPTIRLLKVLVAFWRKKFKIDSPGLRKQGYKDPSRLDQEIKGSRKDPNNKSLYGERLPNKESFLLHARHMNGSRDVSAQLFTALMRSLGVETRLVASLQPLGFGWGKGEEANAPKNLRIPSSMKKSDGVGAKSTTKPTSDTPTSTAGDPTSRLEDASDSALSSALSSNELDSETEEESTGPIQSQRIDRDLPFPTYWTEVLSPVSQAWVPVDPLVLNLVAYKPEQLHLFEPRGARAERSKQVMAYVIAYSADGTAKDVTVRYLKKHIWPGKTKGVRIPVEKIPVYNSRGKVKKYEDYDWFKNVMSRYRRDDRLRTAADDIEDSSELRAVGATRALNEGEGRESLQWYKQSAEYVLERHLRREEALLPLAKRVKFFTTGKGDSAKNEAVYLRKDVVPCKTTESWHKEGRIVKTGEDPLKMVPVRAVTLLRKREIEEEERETGEKAKQGLYAKHQTDWIVPPPIKDGVIPKNTYGNIDVYVPSMVPKGAIHIPLRGTAKVCKELGIDFAEACTGFEFGNKMAVPVIDGVVIATEYEDAVIDAWHAREQQKQKKEAEKREKMVLGMWKKMLLGLRVVERFKTEYGNNVESHMAHAMQEIESKNKSHRLPKKNQGTAQPGKRATRESLPSSIPSKSAASNPPTKYERKFELGDNHANAEETQVDQFGGKDSETSTSNPFTHGGGFFLDDGLGSNPIHLEKEAGSTSKASESVSQKASSPATYSNTSPGSNQRGKTRREPKPHVQTRTRREAAKRSARAMKSHFFHENTEDHSDEANLGSA